MGQLSHAELTWAKKVLGWLCAELNLWRVKVSVPLTIRVRIRTLSFPLSHSHSSSPTLPSPSLPPFKSQEPPSARTTTVVARPPPLVREQMLSPSSYSPQLTVAIARPSQVSLSFSPFPVLLTNSCSSLTQALWATPAPPHAQALLHRSGTFFFFSFSIHADLKCIGHVITAASTAQPTTTRYQPHLVARQRYPLAQRVRRAGEQEASTSSRTPVTGRRGADDRADVTSTTAPMRQARRDGGDHHYDDNQRQQRPATTTTTCDDDHHHHHCNDDHDGGGGDANGGSGSKVVITVVLMYLFF